MRTNKRIILEGKGTEMERSTVNPEKVFYLSEELTGSWTPGRVPRAMDDIKNKWVQYCTELHRNIDQPMTPVEIAKINLELIPQTSEEERATQHNSGESSGVL